MFGNSLKKHFQGPEVEETPMCSLLSKFYLSSHSVLCSCAIINLVLRLANWRCFIYILSFLIKKIKSKKVCLSTLDFEVLVTLWQMNKDSLSSCCRISPCDYVRHIFYKFKSGGGLPVYSSVTSSSVANPMQQVIFCSSLQDQGVLVFSFIQSYWMAWWPNFKLLTNWPYSCKDSFMFFYGLLNHYIVIMSLHDMLWQTTFDQYFNPVKLSATLL